jgi:molybdopterin converting factor small subunit
MSAISSVQTEIQVTVNFYSFFKDLAGCAGFSQSLPAGSALSDLLKLTISRFPRLEPLQKSMLMAVGVEYQDRAYVLRAGDEVSLFPPVQGG